MTKVENLPLQLREEGLFCLWKYEEQGGRRTKVPYDPRTGKRARSNDPATFAPLAAAVSMQAGYDGLGVGIFGDVCAIDIDHCIGEDGRYSQMAMAVVAIVDGYTELSPSGRGIRIFCRAPKLHYDKDRYYISKQKIGLEIYAAGVTGKYVTATGDKLPESIGTLEDRSRQVQEVLDRFMLREAPARAGPEKQGGQGTGRAATPAPEPDDAVLLQRAGESKGGQAFLALYGGDISGYPSHSEADLALCSRLAYWTNRDPARVDKLFRQSGLMRQAKWDRKQSGSTYGALTIAKAMQGGMEGRYPRLTAKEGEVLERDAYPAAIRSGNMRDGAQGLARQVLASFHPERHYRYGWHDLGSGNLFSDWSKGRAVYVKDRKRWFVFNGRAWEPDIGDMAVTHMCKQLAQDLTRYALSLEEETLKASYLKFVSKWMGHCYREIILRDAASVRPVLADAFDRDPWVLNCLNGTLDLRSGSFRAHKPEDMLTNLTGVNYDPEARCPRWESFFDEVMQGDRDRASFLQKALGYSLTGDTSQECLFILYGPTSRNGKGTTMETVVRVMGSYAKTASPDTIAQKNNANSGAPNEDLARLAGARLVSIAENDKHMKLSAATVKSLTGNDTQKARNMYEGSFEFRPQFKILINTNHLPSTNDPSLFTSGRMKVIPFERHFRLGERDTGLKETLAQPENLSGILNWMLEGLRMYRAEGLDMPGSVAEATDEYREASDKLGRFLKEEMEAGPDYWVSTTEAHARYQSWCAVNGLYPEGLPNFKSGLAGIAVVKRIRPAGADRTAAAINMVAGYRLRPIFTRSYDPTPWDEDNLKCVPVCTGIL